MAQNITLMGASYSAVPAVTLPKTGGGTATFTDTSDATLNNGNKMLSGNTAYSNGTKYTGSITSKSAQTYTPTTTNQTIAAGQYLTGTQTIKGDANLLAENIKKDVSIFSIVGSYEGGGGGTAKTVTVTLGYPVSPSYFQSVTIYEGVYADTSPFPFTRGAQIGTITSATGSATVTVSAESNGIECVLRGGYLSVSQGGLHFQGAIGGMNEFPGGDSPKSIFFAVAGNGLVELDFIDWDD